MLTRLLRDDAFEVVISPDIIEETLRALTHPKARRYIRATVEPHLSFEDIVLLAHLVDARQPFARVSVDPDDDTYLAATVEGRAAFVVSGDPDLLSSGEYEGVRIVAPRAFLSLLPKA